MKTYSKYTNLKIFLNLPVVSPPVVYVSDDPILIALIVSRTKVPHLKRNIYTHLNKYLDYLYWII